MHRSVWTTACAVAALALGAATLYGHPAPHDAPPATLRTLYGLSRPRTLAPRSTALVLVDVQNEFLTGRLALPDAKAALVHLEALASWARRSQILVVRVQQVAARAGSPVFAPGSAGLAFAAGFEPAPGDFLLKKSKGGAFSQTELNAELRRRGIDTLVVAGFMTHLAVLTTASDAAMLGYRVLVAADATATRALPGTANEAGVDARLLQRAVLAAMADRVADVLLARELTALPLERP